MGELVAILTDADNIKARRQKAREEFTKHCVHYYGFMPFNKEYLDKCWPLA